ncbi:MAG: Gfo/Idh/MocA family protein [Acidimicrobiia bacterium]
METRIRIGAIGAGGFGLFALQHFAQVPGVSLVAMAGTHREAAIATAKRFGIPDIEEVDRLVARADVDLVYIATPPFLHHPNALKALEAGKHVICEKPLAMTLEQADELISVAKSSDLLVIANLMQRYNPLYNAVTAIVESKVLGEFCHGYLENYASDEGLKPDHWFWDRTKSGGIFVEHGVHFFDMFAGWLGPGEVLAAQRTLRPGSGLEEQVNCTLRYGDGALVNLYHGFTQPNRLDRQEFRLLFELGDVTLHEWVPVRARIHALLDEERTRTLMDLLPGARLDISHVYSGSDRKMFSRHHERDIYQMIEVGWVDATEKLHRYGELLRNLLSDQLKWIGDRSHRRKVTEENGRDSLAMALTARGLADRTGYR